MKDKNSGRNLTLPPLSPAPFLQKKAKPTKQKNLQRAFKNFLKMTRLRIHFLSAAAFNSLSPFLFQRCTSTGTGSQLTGSASTVPS